MLVLLLLLLLFDPQSCLLGFKSTPLW